MNKLETRAIVVSTDGEYALVQPEQANGCGHCNGKGCGASKLSRLFCNKPHRFQVKNQIKATEGDEVIVSVVEGAVLRGIGLLYLIPLVMLLIGALLGNSWSQQAGNEDGYAALGALCGLMIGFFIAKWSIARQAESHFQPYIARHYLEEV